MTSSHRPRRHRRPCGGGGGWIWSTTTTTTTTTTSVAALLLVWVLLPTTVVLADWGDAVDPTFECPAWTTCKQVCVKVEELCPIEMRCGTNETLCPDGTCVETTSTTNINITCAGKLESPCIYTTCAPIACNKVDNYHNLCLELYGPLYENETLCEDEEATYEQGLYSYTENGYVFCYTWMSCMIVLLLGWCAFNQRISPVPGSVQPLNIGLENTNSTDNIKNIDKEQEKLHSAGTSRVSTNITATSWQVGYRIHPVGMCIYVLILMTTWGIQVLLAWLTIQYYVEQGAITGLTQYFVTDVQVLASFVLTWIVGFIWTFSLKFPFSIKSLFLRRCLLEEATHVAICVHHEKEDEKAVTFDETYLRNIRKVFGGFFGFWHAVLTFLFSDQNTFGHPRTGHGMYDILPVQKETYQVVKTTSDPPTDQDQDPNNNNDPNVIISTGQARFVIFQFQRYNLQGDRFVPGIVQVGTTIPDIVNAYKSHYPNGLSTMEVEERRRIVGNNKIDIAKPTYGRCLLEELSRPFYTYQNFMVWSWFPMWYYYMAIVWTIIIFTSAFIVSYFQYRNQQNLYKLTAIEGNVEVTRDGKIQTIPHQCLVPGDVLTVGVGVAFCDMVVVSSKGSLLVDESALTGEANPVGKVALDANATTTSRNNVVDDYDPKRHKRNTILAGTSVLDVNDDEARAIVMQIGCFTSRGEWVRDIHTFSRHQFKFDVEVPIVLVILFFYAVFGFVITNYFLQDQLIYAFFYGIYVAGTTLPPLLPTVFTVSVGVSNDRLSRKRVACANSENILVAGKVKRAFFDKTGTLTKQGLDFLSVRSRSRWNQHDEDEQDTTSNTLHSMSEELTTGMAVCHTLTHVMATGDNVGNPVDNAMFQASNTRRKSQQQFVTKNGNEITVLRRFDFDHNHMTLSVIAQSPDGTRRAYVKGSGEKIKKICNPETLPSDFDSVLRDSAREGIYQISMAVKTIDSNIDVQSMKREDVESNLSFAGVINFKNSLREDTPGVIQHLTEGDIQSTMVTGDSILTGICIAKEAGIIGQHDKVLVGELTTDDEKPQLVWRDYDTDAQVDLPSSVDDLKASGTKLAISGEAFSHISLSSPSLAEDLMDFIRVFGRCTPSHKVEVVSSFVYAGFITMMCGDGGNDCGALRTAHVGVALSDAEASTVAPFTSLDKSIASVVEVLREGRCALASAFAAYKYMLLYGQIETINQIICAYFAITFSEWCWVFMDGVWTVFLALTLPLARAAPKLAPTRPTASILSLHTFASILGIILLNFSFVVGSYFYLWRQDFFQCRKWTSSDVSNVLIIGDNYETETLFIVAGAQYISSAMALNFGYEFRQGWFRNYVFVALVIGFSTMHLYVTLHPGHFSCFWRVNCENDDVVTGVTASKTPIQNDFNTTMMPKYYQKALVGMVIGNALVIAGWEYFVVNGIRRYMAQKKRNQNNDDNNNNNKSEMQMKAEETAHEQI